MKCTERTFHLNFNQILFYTLNTFNSLFFWALHCLHSTCALLFAFLLCLRLRPLFGLWICFLFFTLCWFLSWFHFLFWWLLLILIFSNLTILVFLTLWFWPCLILGLGLLSVVFLLGRVPALLGIWFFLFFRFRTFAQLNFFFFLIIRAALLFGLLLIINIYIFFG